MPFAADLSRRARSGKQADNGNPVFPRPNGRGPACADRSAGSRARILSAPQAAERLAGPGADLIPYRVPEIGERDLITGGSGLSACTPDPFPAAKLNERLTENYVGTKRTGKGRRKVGRKKRRMRAKIRHRKG